MAMDRKERGGMITVNKWKEPCQLGQDMGWKERHTTRERIGRQERMSPALLITNSHGNNIGFGLFSLYILKHI